MTEEDFKVPRFGIEITFWDNTNKDEITRTSMSDNGDVIIEELKDMIKALKGIEG